MKTILITYAVKEEFIPLSLNSFNVISICTGVGKTNSTFRLTQKIIEEKPDFVLNIGTAGTVSHSLGDIFVATHFIDRDYEMIKLPGINFKIEDNQLTKDSSKLNKWLSTYHKLGICSTGDTFVTQVSSISGDFVDMEAYAQAFVCRELNIPFLSVKYITDIIGQNSVEHWENKLADARIALSKWFEEHNLLALLTD